MMISGAILMFRNSAVKHKFGAKPCSIDSKKFRSKLERSAYISLKHCQEIGVIRFFLRETPFEISKDTRKKHRVDFMVFFSSGSVGFLETKGMDLEAGKLRRVLCEGEYGIKIHVAKNLKDIDCFIKDNA